jgi:hypothetical protein
MDLKLLPKFVDTLADYFRDEAPAEAADVMSDFLMNLKPRPRSM